MVIQEQIVIRSGGRGAIELTRDVDKVIAASEISRGLCNVFVLHTSASLVLCENADPDVRHDMERFMSRLVPDGDPAFQHTAEGPDDMPAHLRSILTSNSITLPVSGRRCVLGTWQGLYLWEHRHRPHARRIMITVYGE